MKYGCHNRAPYKEPHRMSPNCEYTKTELGKADARCVGCKWREQNELAIPTTSTSAVDSEANQSVCEAAARPDAGCSNDWHIGRPMTLREIMESEDIQIDEWNGLTDTHKVVLIREAPNWTTLQLIEEVETTLRILNK